MRNRRQSINRYDTDREDVRVWPIQIPLPNAIKKPPGESRHGRHLPPPPHAHSLFAYMNFSALSYILVLVHTITNFPLPVSQKTHTRALGSLFSRTRIWFKFRNTSSWASRSVEPRRFHFPKDRLPGETLRMIGSILQQQGLFLVSRIDLDLWYCTYYSFGVARVARPELSQTS